MSQGDCFVVVYNLVVAPNAIENLLEELGELRYIGRLSALRVVHGLPIARVGELAGQRHWHAWFELNTEMGEMVIDLSNDRKVKTTKETFYCVGTLDEDHVWRFTPKEARKLVRQYKTAGPWVHDWESLATV